MGANEDVYVKPGNEELVKKEWEDLKREVTKEQNSASNPLIGFDNAMRVMANKNLFLLIDIRERLKTIMEAK
jgi:hypothetical protein